MQFTPHKRRRTPPVIIVSLIDVLLVVLIFLVVTTTFKREELPQLKLALPTAKKAQPGTSDQPPLLVTIATNAPYFYISNRSVNFDQLQEAFATAAKENPQVAVAIRADRHAPVGEFIKVIDAAKIAQVGSISAITEKER